MPPRDWKLRIEDILDAIEKIQRYTAEMTFDKFVADEMRLDAVVRNITTIGEAARHVPKDVQDRYPNVPWADMRDIRNVVTHEYFRLSLPILWHTTQQNLLRWSLCSGPFWTKHEDHGQARAESPCPI